MLKANWLVLLGITLSCPISGSSSPLNRAEIMRAALRHLAGAQDFGHHQPAGRQSCVDRNLTPFRGGGAAMAGDEEVGELNSSASLIDINFAGSSRLGAGTVDPSWLQPTQMLAGPDGPCGTAASDRIQLSVPELKDADHALVYFSLICGDLCGTGEVLTLERQNGVWRVTDREQQWVS